MRLNITQGIHMQRYAGPMAEALDEVRAEIGLEPDPRFDTATAILRGYSQPRSVASSTACARSTAPSLP